MTACQIRRILRLGAGLLLLASLAHAQGSSFTLPPGSAIPNYDRVGVGQREALEGNAYVARTDDAGANWYNPAGLSQSEKSALNASSNAYEFTTFSLEGISRKSGATRFNSLGTFFGGVLGAPVIGSDKLRLGFAYSKPVLWMPGQVSGQIEGPANGATESLLYSSTVSFSTGIPSVNAGYRMNDRLRVGVGIEMPMTSLDQNQTLSNRLVDASTLTTEAATLEVHGGSTGVRLNGGLQVDLLERLTIGVQVATPTANISGSTQIIVGLTNSSGAAGLDGTFIDKEADFVYKQPWRLNVGAALRFARGAVEADLRMRGAIEAYELVASDVTATLVTTDSLGVPTTTLITFAPIVEAARAVYNVAVGGNYALTDNMRIHAGVFTDASPVANPTTSIFRALDMVGVSAGLSFGKIAGLSGSVGANSTWGTSGERVIGPSLSGSQYATKVTVQTFGLTYAVSYGF